MNEDLSPRNDEALRGQISDLLNPIASPNQSLGSTHSNYQPITPRSLDDFGGEDLLQLSDTDSDVPIDRGDESGGADVVNLLAHDDGHAMQSLDSDSDVSINEGDPSEESGVAIVDTVRSHPTHEVELRRSRRRLRPNVRLIDDGVPFAKRIQILVEETQAVDPYGCVPSEPHYLGPMDQTCPYCGAAYFKAELTREKKYSKCCMGGKVRLAPIPVPLKPIRDLLEGNGVVCRIVSTHQRKEY